jgi:hypothetical protein
MKKICLPAVIFITVTFLPLVQGYSQGLAVNTTAAAADASAMLDIASATKGMLAPRMTQAQRTAISSPATGLLVYQTDGTDGFYYNSGTPSSPIWVNIGAANNVTGVTVNSTGTITVTDGAGSVTSAGKTWAATGNSGTTAGTNFVGTTDAQAFVIKTNGSASTNERMRFLTTPQVVINRTTAQSGDLLSVYGSSYAGAINTVSGQTDYPINAYSTGAFAGVYGENTATGQGLLGLNTSTGVGVYGQNTSSGIGVFGISTSGVGVYGSANGALVTGVRGFNQNATGTGILALGNNIAAGTVNPAGSGLAANGAGIGIYSIATTAATGIGLLAGGNNMTTITTPIGTGAGIVGQGESFGSVGYASTAAAPLTNNKWGGYFDYLASADGYAYVGGRTGSLDYGIISTGTKSTMIKDNAGHNRILYCTEAPEVLFQDYGSGTLVNGRAHVDMDPMFTRSIAADHPIRVFIQPEGDCKGVYVTNTTSAGFDVIELNGGTSNISFTWQITGNRTNTYDASGNIANEYAAARFPVGPDRVRSEPSKAAVVTQSAEIPVPAKVTNAVQKR